jgi:hypothetical protein
MNHQTRRHGPATRGSSHPAPSRRRVSSGLLVGMAVVAVSLTSQMVSAGDTASTDTGTTSPDTTTPNTTTPDTTTPDTTTPGTTTPGTTIPGGTGASTTSPGSSLPDTVGTPTGTSATSSTTSIPGTPAPAAQNVLVGSTQLDQILATIRFMESRGNYLAPPNRGNASGAYQFIASTWAGYGGYSHAYLAPPVVQDERATFDVNRFLFQWHNDVSMIPVMWYFPLAATDPTQLDVVPKPWAGNVLTVREYQQRWLAVFSFISGKPVPAPLTQADVLARAGLPPTVLPSASGAPSITFPVLGPTRVAAPDCEHPDAAAAGLCTPHAPGILFGVKLQPVLAVHDGVVTEVVDEPGRPISVRVTDLTGRSYTLAGFNDDNPGTDDGQAPAYLRLSSLAVVGQSVRAGQVLGFMGDTDPLPSDVRSDVPTDRTIKLDPKTTAPNIRLTITDPDGSTVDAYGPVIDALFRQACSVAIGPWIMPPNGSGHKPITIETTDVNPDIDSQWVINESGQVTGAGWAAMIYPNQGCTFTPPDAHGPGAAGFSAVPMEWATPFDLPTSIWIDLALQSSKSETPAVPVRRG